MRRMHREYWRAVAARAIRETREALRIETRDRVVLAILSVMIAFLLLGVYGTEGAAFDYSLEKLGVAALILSLFPIFFVYKLVAVPAKQDAEKQTAIDNLKDQLKPQISIDYKDDRDFCVFTPIGDPLSAAEINDYFSNDANVGKGRVAYYIRVRVTNTGTELVRNCQTYITQIDLVSGDEERNLFRESLPLAWAVRSSVEKSFSKIDLHVGVPEFVDVFFIDDTGRKPQLLIEKLPHRYYYLFDELGDYILTIRAVADNAYSREIRLKFNWDGEWHRSGIHITSLPPVEYSDNLPQQDTEQKIRP